MDRGKGREGGLASGATVGLLTLELMIPRVYVGWLLWADIDTGPKFRAPWELVGRLESVNAKGK